MLDTRSGKKRAPPSAVTAPGRGSRPTEMLRRVAPKGPSLGSKRSIQAPAGWPAWVSAPMAAT